MSYVPSTVDKRSFYHHLLLTSAFIMSYGVTSLEATLTVPPDKTDAATITYNGGSIGPGSTYTINLPGHITNNAGTLSNNGTITNNSSFLNNDTLNNNDDGTITNNRTFTNGNGRWLNNFGTLNNESTLLNIGTINNNGTIHNLGNLANNGTLNNNDDGTITNNNTFSIGGGRWLNNSGTINNLDSLNNSGTLSNNGTITNNGNFINSDTFYNNDDGTITNNNTFTNGSGHRLINFGTITNEDTLTNRGTINNLGNLNNNRNVVNIDTIYNYGTLTFNVNSSAVGSGSLIIFGGMVVSNLNLTIPWAIQLGNLNNTNFIQPAVGTTLTLSGVIANYPAQSVNLTFNGLGTTVLSNANTYTGGSVLSGGGTLQLGNDAALGTGSVALNGGTLRTNGNRTVNNTVMVNADSTIDNGGRNFVFINQISVAANAHLTLDGNGAGQTVVNNLSLNGTLTNTDRLWNNGVITSTQGSVVNLSGGSNLLGLGPWNFSGSTLNDNANSTIPWDIRLSPGSTNTFDNFINSEGGNTLILDGIISDAAPSNAAGLTFGGPGSTIVNGANSYSGETRIGAISVPTTVSMGHANALGTGPITLIGGSTLNPFAGSLALNSTRSLSGVGLVAGNVINQGGLINPGQYGNPSTTYGTLSVGGDYTGSGTLRVHLKPAANASNAPVGGADYTVLDLGNHNFDASTTSLDLVVAPGTYVSSAQYRFLTTTGAVNGTFPNDQSLPTVGAYRPTVAYNQAAGGGAALMLQMSRIYLVPALGDEADRISNPIAAYLDAQPNPALDDPLGDVINVLDDLSGRDLDRALDALAPEDSDDTTFLFQESSHQSHKVHTSRLRAQRAAGRSGGTLSSLASFALHTKREQSYHHKFLNSLSSQNPTSVNMRPSTITKANARSEMDRAMQNSVAETLGKGGYWTHAFGSLTRQDDSGDDIGFRAQTGGILVGGDVKFSPQTFFGVSGGYTKTLMRVNDNGGTHHLDAYMMSLYGTWFNGPLSVDYSLTGSVNVYNMVRRVLIGMGPATNDAPSQHQGYEISPLVGVAYEITYEGMSMTPFASATFSMTRERGYKETIGLLEQQIKERNSYFLITEVGMTFEKDFKFEDKVFTPNLKLGYTYKRPIKTGDIVGQFAGAVGFYSIQSTNKPLHEFSPGLEGTLRWKNGLYLGASYGAELSKNYRVHELTLKLGKRF